MPVASPSTSLEEKADGSIIKHFHWLGLSCVPEFFDDFLPWRIPHQTPHASSAFWCVWPKSCVISERLERRFLYLSLEEILISIPFIQPYIYKMGFGLYVNNNSPPLSI